MITLESPELNAQVAALEAAKAQAQAQLDLSLHGTREESIRNLEAVLAQAKVEAANATRDYQRISTVASQGYVSATELDNARRSRDVASQRVRAAQAELMKPKWRSY